MGCESALTGGTITMAMQAKDTGAGGEWELIQRAINKDQSAIRTTGLPALAGEVVEIKISDLAFIPASVTVHTGDRISWLNDDFLDHTVTDNDNGFDEQIAAGKTLIMTMSKSGSISYYCRVHPNMTGQVIVLDR